MKRFRTAWLTAGCLTLFPLFSSAQTIPAHPEKPVTLVVSWPAGGAPDQIARMLAPHLQKRWNVPVIVQNRAGAAGHIGNDSVARAEPDGHTLLITPNTITMAIHTLTAEERKPRADVLTELTPISLLSSSTMLLLAHPSLNLRTVDDLVQAARKDPDLGYASPGYGSPMHLVGEMFNRAAGVNIRHIPYKGTSPAITDLLGGHVKLTFLGLPVAKPLVDSQRLVPLAAMDTQRSGLMPDLPTAAEQGLTGVDIDIWFGVYAPKDTPAALADTLHQTLSDILKEPAVLASFQTMNQEVRPLSRAAFVEKHKTDYQRYGDLIQDLGINAP